MTSRTEITKYRKKNLLLKRQIEEGTGKTVEQLYAERSKRVRDVKCGKKGGLIVVIKMPDKAGIEDMQARLKSIAEYGRY